MKMRWVAAIGVLMVAGAMHLWFGPAYGLTFGGIGLFLLAGWCAFVDGM